MKKIILGVIFLGLFMVEYSFAQRIPVERPTFFRYRKLSLFNGDTTAYLKYNWNRKNATQYAGKDLSSFFSQFELPIKAMRFRMSKTNITAIIIYYRPYSVVSKLSYKDGFEGAVIINFAFEKTPLISSLEAAIPALKRRDKTKWVTDIIIPWHYSYENTLKNCTIDYITFSGLQ